MKNEVCFTVSDVWGVDLPPIVGGLDAPVWRRREQDSLNDYETVSYTSFDVQDDSTYRS